MNRQDHTGNAIARQDAPGVQGANWLRITGVGCAACAAFSEGASVAEASIKRHVLAKGPLRDATNVACP
jgi:hypothetical protein